MSEELNGLLKKIREDGLEKAEAERESILNAAKAEADALLQQAKAEAEAIRKNAAADAEVSQAKANAAIKQAARDVVISLKSALEEKLRNVVSASVKDAMTPQEMATLIQKIAEQFLKDDETTLELELSASGNAGNAVSDKLLASLSDDLRKRTEIKNVRGFAHGFKIGFSDSSVYLDFSDTALTDVICEFVGPKLAAVIKG